MLKLDDRCSEFYIDAQLAHQNVLDCADNFPNVELLLPDNTSSSPSDFFTAGYTFSDGLTTVIYRTEGGNCAFSIDVRGDAGFFAIDCPDNLVVDLGTDDCNAVISAADLVLNYSGPGTISYRVEPETLLDGFIEGTGQLPDYTVGRGRTVFRYNVVEPGGCEANCAFSMLANWEATSAIDFACQDATYIYRPGEEFDFRAAYLSGAVRAEDDCGASPVTLALGFLTNCDQIGVAQEVRLSVGNGGFQQTCSFNLTLVAPDFTPNCPVNPLFVDLGEDFPQALPPEDLANWTANPGLTATSDKPFINCGDIGRHFITVTLEDECGNTANCTRDVRVRDSENPTLVCQNISRSLDENGDYLLSPADIIVSATDNCGAENLGFTLTQELFTCDDRGNNTVFMTTRDSGGSSRICSATVTITDEIFPEISCQDVTIELGADGTYQLQINDVVASASDNCNVAYRFSQRDFSCDDLANSPVTVTMRGRDASGNSSFCDAVVTIETPDCPCIGADGILVVNNPENVALCEDLTVSGVNFIAGNLNLAGYTLTIENDGRIQNEDEDSFIVDLSGGKIVTLNTSDNFLDLIRDFGLELFVSDDLGFPRLERSNLPVTIDGFPSIYRVITVEESFSPVINDARFYYLDAELNGLVEEDLGLYVEQNGVWESVPVLDRNTTENWVEFDLDFSQLTDPVRFTLTNAAALPLDLLSFRVEQQSKVNDLFWTTANEEGFSHFEVERSSDGNAWLSLGAIAGAGEVEGAVEYDYVDSNPPATAYYRLRMVDLDGSFAFSPVVYLEREDLPELRVFPNPNSGSFTLQLPEATEPLHLAIYTVHGTCVRAQKVALGTTSLPLHEQLISGVYLLVVESNTDRWAERIVVH